MDRILQIGKYEVHLFLNDIDTQNIVFELAFENHGADVLSQCREMGVQPFHYAVVTGFDWENDLSPWPASGLVSKNDSFGGKADAFLQALIDDIVPRVIGEVRDSRVAQNSEADTSTVNYDNRTYHCTLIGYSLAGLTALYSGYKHSTFNAVGSVSGALWYPKFLEFVQQNTLQSSVKVAYLSLGDKEHKTRNPYMSQVQERTEAIHKLLESRDMRTVFELNHGNHFKDEVLRIAKCIDWIYQDA